MTLQSHAKLEFFLAHAIFILLVLTVASIVFSIAVSSIALGGAIVLWLAHILITQGKVFQPTSLEFFFLAYVAAELIATLFSVDLAASLFNGKRLFLLFVVYLTFSSLTTQQKYVWALGIFLGTNVLLSVVEVLMLSKIGGGFERLGFFQHYMTAGGMKMIVLVLLIPFILEKTAPLKWRITAGASFVPSFLALALTQTRSSWLGLLAGGITLGACKYRKLLVALPIFVILFLLLVPHDLQSRAASIFDPALRSNVARIHMIETGWQMFLDYPIVGTGDIDLKRLYVTYREPVDAAEGGHLHNNLMMLLVTLGAVGFIAVMVLFVKIFQAEWNAFKQSRSHWLYGSATLGSLAAYVGFHINGLFEWNFGDHEIAVYLWFSVGLTLSSVRLLQPAQTAEST